MDSEYGLNHTEDVESLTRCEIVNDVEYVNMELPSGVSVRFKRVWSNHRFTDYQVALLIAGMQIRIKTPTYDGIVGSLEWQEFNGYSFFGFLAWSASDYTVDHAPVPLSWNTYVFSDAERKELRSGRKLLTIQHSTRTLRPYALHLSLQVITSDKGFEFWGIVPHFDEFDKKPRNSRDCLFMPSFKGYTLSIDEIAAVRLGHSIKVSVVDSFYPECKTEGMIKLISNPSMTFWELVPV